MHFCIYLIYNFCTLYMFRTTISFIIRSSQVTVSGALYKPFKRAQLLGLTVGSSNRETKAADTVTCGILMINEIVVRNM